MKLNETSKNILRFLGLRILSFAINVLLMTVRFDIKNKKYIDELKNSGINYVLAFWHGTMIASWFIGRDNNSSALVSTSKDGDLLASVLDKWNYRVVRGSSHIGGKEALNIMLDMAKNNFNVAITPDGPTGPPREMKAGAVVISKKAAVPLVLLGVAYSNKFVLNSWDRFEIPKPFSKAVAVFSEPFSIDGDLSYDDTSAKILECNNILNNLQKEAELLCLTR